MSGGSLSRSAVQQVPSGPLPPLSLNESGDTGDQGIDAFDSGSCPPTQMQVTLVPTPPLSHSALPKSVTAEVSESSPSFDNSVLFGQGISANSVLEPVISLAGGTTHAPLPDGPRTSESTPPDSGSTHHCKTSVDNIGKRFNSPNISSPLRRSIGTPIRLPAPPSTFLPPRTPITEGSSPSGTLDAPIGRSPSSRETFSVTRPNVKKSTPENNFSVQSLPKFSFNALSDGNDSSSQSGGSDSMVSSEESEVDLQKQAEIKAALLAQTSAEEQEFRAARQKIVDLRPPKSWPGLARFR